MNQGEQRIPCPKCRANNFLGKTNCWQCGSSLPPPEAFGATPAAYVQPAQPAAFSSGQAPLGYHPQASAKRGGPAIAIAVAAVLVIVVVGAFAMARSRGHRGVPGNLDLSPEQMRQIREFQNSVRQSSGSSDLSSSTDPDSPESQGRREIKRLEDKGLVPSAPKPDSEGRIHLQSGGTISPEEWERARQSLGGAGARGY